MSGRRTRKFTNERGNRITVSIESGPAKDQITYSIAGPNSDTENTITRNEAKVLQSMIGMVLK